MDFFCYSNFAAKMQLFKLIQEIKSTRAYCKTSVFTRIQIMIIDESSNVLQLLYEFYSREKEMEMMKLAAFWSLREALRCKNNIENISRCFKNLLNTHPKLYSIDKIIFNEIFKSLCYQNLDKRALEEICGLYTAIMQYQ